VIATVPGDDGVYVTWHELVLELVDERLHVLALNEPPLPPSSQVTLPSGGVGELFVSLTVAVNVIEFPVVTEAGLGDTVVVVECSGVSQLKTAVKELSLVIDMVLRFFVSPVSSQWSKEHEP
jgi:hypothetical protein